MKQSSKMALGGIVAALSLVLLISVAIIPFMTYALPAIAGTLTVFMVMEVNKKWAFGVYAAVAILGIFLVPDKEVSVMYLAFFGYYPILKAIIEKHLHPVTAWIAKLAVFLLTMVGSYFLMIKLMGLTVDEIEEHGIWGVAMLLGIGTFAFVFYDIAISKFVLVYEKKWRKQFRKYFK